METTNELKSEVEIPYGYCHCGCGEKTTIATRTDRKANQIKNKPLKYLPYHHAKLQQRKPSAKTYNFKSNNKGRKLKSHCKNGHKRTLENVDHKGRCKTCLKLQRASQQYKEKRKLSLKRNKGIRNANFCKNGHERTAENLKDDGTCKLCIKAKNKTPERLAKLITFNKENPEKRKQAIIKYDKSEKGKKSKKKWSKLAVLNLTNSYIATASFKISVKEIPQYAIELARELIKGQRELRELH